MIRKLWLQRSHPNIELEALAGEALQIEPKDVRIGINACRTAGRAIAHFKLDPWRRDQHDDLVPFDQALEIVTMLARNPATIEPKYHGHRCNLLSQNGSADYSKLEDLCLKAFSSPIRSSCI